MVFASLSFLLAFGVSLQAKPVQFKGVQYTLPAGWKAAQNGDAQILSPSGMPANKLLAVMIIPAIPKSDKSWKETFQAFLDAATKTVTVVSKSEIQSTTRAPYELFVQVQKQNTAHASPSRPNSSPEAGASLAPPNTTSRRTEPSNTATHSKAARARLAAETPPGDGS